DLRETRPQESLRDVDPRRDLAAAERSIALDREQNEGPDRVLRLAIQVEAHRRIRLLVFTGERNTQRAGVSRAVCPPREGHLAPSRRHGARSTLSGTRRTTPR